MEPQHDYELEALKAAWWKKTGGDNPFGGLSVPAFFDRIRLANPQVFRPLSGKKVPIACADDRLVMVMGERYLGYPGSVGLEQSPVFTENFGRFASEVILHEHCGAEKELADRTGDRSALETRARKLADKKGVHFRAGRLSVVPHEIHPARVLLGDFSGQLDYRQIGPIVHGFFYSAFLDGEDLPRIIGNTTFLIKIALGEHGQGERFTPESPFYLIVLTEGKKELVRRIRQLKPLESEFNNRVRVVGYDVSRKAA